MEMYNGRETILEPFSHGEVKERTNCWAYITRFSEPRHREISYFGTRPLRLRGSKWRANETSCQVALQTKRDRQDRVILDHLRIINVGFRETFGFLPGRPYDPGAEKLGSTCRLSGAVEKLIPR